jgi:poly(A) polymerase
MQRADLAALVAALGAGEARYVGGAVRDTLLGLPVKDIDMATRLVPAEVIARLEAAGIRHVPTGIDHGTVTALLAGGPVELTTLRRDVSTDGRRATVAFAGDWSEDAARRDFTINALYADPEDGTILDWFGGLDDLAARRVRFIGDARQRIREDHLRILRYFRFQARFGSQPADEEAEISCAELAPMLKGLSRERVGMEMMNLLGLPDPATLFSPDAGLTSLMTKTTNPTVSGQVRAGSEVLTTITGTIPGDAVVDLFTIGDRNVRHPSASTAISAYWCSPEPSSLTTRGTLGVGTA